MSRDLPRVSEATTAVIQSLIKSGDLSISDLAYAVKSLVDDKRIDLSVSTFVFINDQLPKFKTGKGRDAIKSGHAEYEFWQKYNRLAYSIYEVGGFESFKGTIINADAAQQH